jgi:hypothetical protein
VPELLVGLRVLVDEGSGAQRAARELEHGNLSLVELAIRTGATNGDQCNGVVVVGQDITELELETAAALLCDLLPQPKDLVGPRCTCR